MIRTKKMLDEWVKLYGARPGDESVLGKSLPNKPILPVLVQAEPEQRLESVKDDLNISGEARESTKQRRNRAPGTPTAKATGSPITDSRGGQTSIEKSRARKNKWREKNKDKIAANTRKCRAQKKQQLKP